MATRGKTKRNYRGRQGPRPNKTRDTYQKQRFEGHRKEKNKETQALLSEQIRKSLYPGVKDGATALERLEALNTTKAITMTITTRAIGFSTLHIFSCLYQFNNVPVRGSIYQLYRVALGVIEAKVQIVQRGTAMIMDNEDDYKHHTMNEEWIQATKTVVVVPDQLSSIINTVGKVKVYENNYVPKLAVDNYSREGDIIPQSEQLVLSNLRRVVMQLANPETRTSFRLSFYRNNPIPGAIWNVQNPASPVLMNPTDICPENYTVQDYLDDVDDLRHKFTFMNKKAPKYFSKPINFEPEGTKSLLMNNVQNGMKCCDRQLNEDLFDYYKRARQDIPISRRHEILESLQQLDPTIRNFEQIENIVIETRCISEEDEEIPKELSQDEPKLASNFSETEIEEILQDTLWEEEIMNSNITIEELEQIIKTLADSTNTTEQERNEIEIMAEKLENEATNLDTPITQNSNDAILSDTWKIG